MPQRTQFIGYPGPVLATMVGYDRELMVDLTRYRIVIHDGVTPGGAGTTALLSDLADYATLTGLETAIDGLHAELFPQINEKMPTAGGTFTGAVTHKEPVVAENTLTVHSQVVGATNASRIAPALLLGRNNHIINGGFSIWQRRTSFVAIPSGTFYTADHWRIALAGTSLNAACDRVSLTPGHAVPGGELQYAMALNLVSGTYTSVAIEQPIEDVRTIAGRHIAIAFSLLSSVAGGAISAELVQRFGTGGSADVVVPITLSANTTQATWTAFSGTCEVPALTGKTIGAGSHTLLRIRLPNTAGVTHSITAVTLVNGRDSVPYTLLARPDGVEEMLCRRYYEKSYDRDVTPGTASALSGMSIGPTQSGALNSAIVFIEFSVPKRGTPSMTAYNPSTGTAGQMRDGANTASTATFGASVIGQRSAYVYNSGSALAANNTAQVHWTAEAEFPV